VVVSGSAGETNRSEGSGSAERLALAETLSAPLQADEPFERLVRTVLDGMVPDFGDIALGVVPSEEGGYEVIVSARTPDGAERVRHLVRELLPVLTAVARDEVRRGRTFHWLPTIRRSALRLQNRYGADLFPRLEALGVHSIIAVGLRRMVGSQWKVRPRRTSSRATVVSTGSSSRTR
jgi:hypothetical protein